MREVGVLEAKTHLSALLDEVRRGEEVVITRHGKPLARLSGIPARPERVRRSGEELVARAKALQERIARESPAMVGLTWEELKKTGRE